MPLENYKTKRNLVIQEANALYKELKETKENITEDINYFNPLEQEVKEINIIKRKYDEKINILLQKNI
jgi:DNA repair ATPase RecN